MSASLVGSEMCIRDSPWCPQCPPRPWGRHRGGWGGCLARHLRAGPCRGAVSYTHLTLPTICSV
eukprot:9720988-Alexandrium_andersonii.AAC.1